MCHPPPRKKPYIYTLSSHAASLLYHNAINGAITKFDERKEQRFKSLLESAFKDINIITQYPVKGKRIDFYLPEYKLAIEFDEEQHKSQQEDDKVRQSMIEKELGCRFIRVPEGQEGAGIIAIYKEITHKH